MNQKIYSLHKNSKHNYGMFTKPEKRRTLNYVLKDLEKHGRAFTTDGTIPRYLSYRFKQSKEQKQIFFTWNKKHRTSVITLKPDCKLKIINDNKIRIRWEQM